MDEMGPGKSCWSYLENPPCRSLDGEQNSKNAFPRQGFSFHTHNYKPHSTQYAGHDPPTAHRTPLRRKFYTSRYARWSPSRGNLLEWPLFWYPPSRPPPESGALGHRNNNQHDSRSGRVLQMSACTTARSPIPRVGSRSHGGRLGGNPRLPQGSADCDDLYRARASFPCLVPFFPSCNASVASASHVASGPSRYHSGVQSSTPSRPKLQ